MNRVFVDMDGVVVDFDAYMKANKMTGDEVKRRPGAYLDMQPIPGAIEAVRSLIGMGFEVWIATKPPTGISYAYSDKAAWVMNYLPELKRRIIVTHDKGMLGDYGDFLCDDRPHKANCEKFAGTLLRFVDGFHWPQAMEYFRGIRHMLDAQPAAATQAMKFSVQELRPEVLAFALLMEQRLRQHDADKRKTWKHMSTADLRVHALSKAARMDSERLDNRHPVDLANYCMMIADVSGSLEIGEGGGV